LLSKQSYSNNNENRSKSSIISRSVTLTHSLIETPFDAFANRVDPDQTAPIGAAWSGSTLFAYRMSLVWLYIVGYGNKIPCYVNIEINLIKYS